MPTLTVSYSGLVNGDTVGTFSHAPNTAPSVVSTATASSQVAGSPYTITASGAVDTDYSITYVGRHAHRHSGGVNDHRQQPDQGLWCRIADADSQLLRLHQWRHLRQPDHSPTLTTTATSEQPRLGQPLHHHGQRRGGFRLLDHVCRGKPHGHAGAALDNHAIQPDQGLRRGIVAPDGQLYGIRQWRHLGQPDDSAHADDDGHRQQPCLGQPLSITASGAVDTDYSISYGIGAVTVTPVALTITANNQSKVYGAVLPTLTVSYSGLVNGDSAASLAIDPTITTTATDEQPCLGQPLQHHRQRRGGCRLQHQLRGRELDRHACGVDDHRQQPVHGRPHHSADADRVIHRARKRRYLRQPHHAADAQHHRQK